MYKHPPAHVVASYRKTILDCILGPSRPPVKVLQSALTAAQPMQVCMLRRINS